MKKYISYLRVSTKKQGVSGLGIEAQRETIERFVGSTGGVIIEEFTDIESGKKDKRPELMKAIRLAKTDGATIIVAKLDRISRNVSFFFQMRDAKVDFQAADIPELNTLTLGIFATIAQYERELISKRTKDALRAKMAQGWKAGQKGKRNLTSEGRAKAAKIKTEESKEDTGNRQVRDIIKGLINKGYSVNFMVNHLNNLEYKTATGLPFEKSHVYWHIKKMNDAKNCKTR